VLWAGAGHVFGQQHGRGERYRPVAEWIVEIVKTAGREWCLWCVGRIPLFICP